MAKILDSLSLKYENVNLIAKAGIVNSRQEVPLEGWRIVVSAMTSIVGPDFITAVSKLPEDLQPTIHIPRDIYAMENMDLAHCLGLKNIFIGIGLKTPQLEECAKICNYNTVLLDVAHGNIPAIKEKIGKLKADGFKVIVGSVSTKEGYADLINAGADIVRSGLGTGSACSTKSQTGFHRESFSEIIDLAEGRLLLNKGLILADGGFKNPGDMVKAFAAGADYCMSGRIFVDVEESRLRMLPEDDELRDVYYGMSTPLGQAAFKGKGKEKTYSEGYIQKLPRNNLRPLKDYLEDYWMAIRSGVSYSGYSNLTDMIGNGLFEIIK